ncbi:MAG: hypothetical protein F4121_07650 [Acidimicrobiia bacterium]|nr:hypothetical protein [Acidimicrobiia bacterium]
MAKTTTIRVDSGTHAQLQALSRDADMSLIDTVRLAAEALRRERFARRAVGELAALREDAAAWEDYLGEAESSAVGDGVG